MLHRLCSAAKEQKRVRNITKKALQLFKNKSLAVTWQRWTSFVKVRRALHSIFDTRMERLKSDTFRAWCVHAGESKRLRVASEHVRQALGALGKRRAWDTWRVALMEKQHAQQRRMRRCFAAIRAFARRRQLQAHRLWLARAQLMRNTALRVLLAWRGHVVDAKKLRTQRIQEQTLRMRLERREMRKRIALQGSVLHEWRNVVIRERHLGAVTRRLQLCLGGPLRTGFARIREAAEEHKREKQGLLRAAQAFRRKGETSALRRWRHFAAERRRMRGAMRTIASRAVHLQAGRALRQWVSVVATAS